MTCGSGVEVTFEIPVTLALQFWCGSGFLSDRQGFTPLNYSHSIVPVEKIEWWTGILPLIIRCGSGVEVGF